jgi:iron-sulfur cluster assembly accessory protein
MTDTLSTPITITPKAAVKVLEFLASEDDGAEVLRVAVQGGGCSGFQYALGFDEAPADGDAVIEMHGVRIVVDPFSLPYLSGADIDFVDGLNGTGFKIENPNVVAGCGCGSSFQMKDEAGDELADGGDAGCSSCASH